MASWDYFDAFFADHLDSTAPRSNYPDPQPVLPALPPTSAPPQQLPSEPYHASDAYVPQEPPRELPSPPQPIPVSQPQQQAPPSPRKSMFEFISPFDALTSNGTTKKKPVPPAPTSSSATNEDSWTSASLGSLNDPKRKSVENLIEQLTRSQAPYSSAQPPSPSYDPYNTADEYSQVDANQSAPQQQSRPMPPPPLPPKPTLVSSPRASPPKLPVQQQPPRQGRSAESPQPIPPVRRDKEGSPGPRSNWKNDNRAKPVNKGKPQSSPRYAPSLPHTFEPNVVQSPAANDRVRCVSAPRRNTGAQGCGQVDCHRACQAGPSLLTRNDHRCNPLDRLRHDKGSRPCYLPFQR